MGGLAAMMAARRASIEGNQGQSAAASRDKSPDEWDEDEKKPAKAEAKEDNKPDPAATKPADGATVAAGAN